MASRDRKTDTSLKKRSIPRRPPRRLIMALAAAALLGLGFWVLWNRAGVPILNIPPLTYWQSLGAILLSGLLLRIGMFAGGRHRGHHANRLATAGCPRSRFRRGNGSGDI